MSDPWLTCQNLPVISLYFASWRTQRGISQRLKLRSLVWYHGSSLGGRDQVVQAALELAKTIAAKSPIAVSGTKRLISHARDHPVEENLVYTQSWNAHALVTNASFFYFFWYV